MLETLTNAINPRADSGYNVRVGIVVYPVEKGGKNDQEGNAAVVQQLTRSKSAVLDRIAAGKLAKNDNQAKATLRFPSTAWTYTPTWVALDMAREMLFTNTHSKGAESAYDASTTKTVIVVTDGAPAQYKGDAVGGSYARSVYHTLKSAKELKDAGAAVAAVGISNAKWQPGSIGHPLVEEGGKGLFLGDHAGANAQSANPAAQGCLCADEGSAVCPSSGSACQNECPTGGDFNGPQACVKCTTSCTYLGTVTITGDLSDLSCGSANKGCGGSSTQTLDSLVSGDTVADKERLSFTVSCPLHVYLRTLAPAAYRSTPRPHPGLSPAPGRPCGPPTPQPTPWAAPTGIPGARARVH